ncbi:hypothetical protein [Sphingomonas sp.]|uniref:hypothetical protein n=1 Tax=Sphingomonas sp. TaxID=28214 RepID=UPI0025FE31B8|nr:hypothetical protein [Sphingomonas sp.]
MPVFAMVVVAMPALAQDGPAAPPPEKKICKTITPTGSIMGKRICLTKSEWRQFDEINERTVDVVTGRSKMSAPKGGGEF